ncbi:MAG: aldehyde ferredoxin oxidoreductase C-terminal domain-containing protein [Methanoregula sp.]
MLDHEKAELRDASAYWGKTVNETTLGLQKDLGDEHTRVLCIGPAGELKSRIACIMSDQYRAAGRGGLGAVMGSKMLKAITARGDLKIGVANPEKFKEATLATRNKITAGPVTSGALADYGTQVLMNLINNSYILPTRNHQTAYFADAEKISGEEMVKTTLVRKKPCYGCMIGCGRGTKIDGKEAEGPEYENAWAFGADCGVDDLVAVTRANNLCNDLGLDAISAGVTIACAMELSEKGYIKEKIQFGDAQKNVELTKMMGYRQGLGARTLTRRILRRAWLGYTGCSNTAETRPAGTGPVITVHGSARVYATVRKDTFNCQKNGYNSEGFIMKINIERDACVSCGTCWDTCPAFFLQNDKDSFSQIVPEYQINGNIAEGTPSPDDEGGAREAADICPAQIIHIEE